jgi:streptomycin 6-kinase
MAVCGAMADLTRRLQSIHDPHLQIEDEYVGTQVSNFFDGDGAVLRLAANRHAAFLLEEHSQGAADMCAVIDDEYGTGQSASLAFALGRLLSESTRTQRRSLGEGNPYDTLCNSLVNTAKTVR